MKNKKTNLDLLKNNLTELKTSESMNINAGDDLVAIWPIVKWPRMD